MKTYPIKRLWNNLASVRDYIVESCIKQQQDLLLVLTNAENKKEYMLIPWKDLETKKFQISTQKIKSRYGSQDYELIDFAWRPTHADREE